MLRILNTKRVQIRPSLCRLKKGLTCRLYLAVDGLKVALEGERCAEVAEAVLAHSVGFPITPL